MHPLKSSPLSRCIDFIDNYDVFIFDVSGTITEGQLDEQQCQSFIQSLQDQDKKTIAFSNMPRPHHILGLKLATLGYDIAKMQIFTSGDHFLEFFNELCEQKPHDLFFHVGGEKNHDLLKNYHNLTLDLEKASAVILTAFVDPEEEDYRSYVEETLRKAKALNLQVFCTNPDKAVLKPKSRHTSGHFAQFYEGLGGNVTYFGKPEKESYAWLFSKLAKQGYTDKSRMIMIGDNLDTDILGANNAGIDSCLVLSGLSSLEQLHHTHGHPTFIVDMIS